MDFPRDGVTQGGGADAAQRTAASAPLAVRVRRASIRDLEVVIALRLALLREHPEHAIYGRLRVDVDERARELFATQLETPGEAIFLADLGGETAGILRCVEAIGSPLLEPARYAYVSSVYVTPALRRRGVLRSLVAAAQQWSVVRKLDQLRLHNVSGSESAERAWSALGFTVVEQVRVRSLPPR